MYSAATLESDLLWVTNLPTPYRAPLWSALGDQHGLTVALLADSEPNRTWKVSLDPDRYSVISLHARPMARSGDSTIYAPSRQLMRLISARPRAVLMDGWESPAYLAARWWATRQNVPVIASYRSTLSTHRHSRGPVPVLRRWFFHGADAVLTAGQASTDAVTSMGIPDFRVVEGFNTVDVERFASGAARFREVSAERLGHHYIYVGQLIRRKNVESLIEAFARVREENDSLTLVGSGPLQEQLKMLCNHLCIDAQVNFAGPLDGDHLVEAYASANTLVLPSIEEVWGLVVNEGLAAGLHAVVSEACGIAPSIRHMPGVICSDTTVQSLSEALRKSRATWTQPMLKHPITLHTPLALSQIIIEIMNNLKHAK
jgi:glycosyltransferase involved in cell wall biosynthesis